MKELSYPFDAYYLLNNRMAILNKLLSKDNLLPKRVAILSTSNTSLIKEFLEIFLLNNGIKPSFYESNNFYDDVIYDNKDLISFDPDIVYICTSNRSILDYPNINTNNVGEMLNKEYKKFENVWKKIEELFNCIIIQNNFDFPLYRLYGNKDATDIHGSINYLSRLNQKFYGYVNSHNNIYICDINYLSSVVGLDKWYNLEEWYLYNYFVDSRAVPYLSFNVVNIIKSLYGKNKKAFAIDLDNTIWGGKISLEGVSDIDLGTISLEGHAFLDFQKYLKTLKDFGIILNINTKNNYESAVAALKNKSNILDINDFVIIKSNNQSKINNLEEIANELNIDKENIIFVDDNKLERKQIEDIGIAVPKLIDPFEYIKVIDRNGYFEVTKYDRNTINHEEMESKLKHSKLMAGFDHKNDYLKSLNMKADICSVDNLMFSEVHEFMNNRNTFNLTTKKISTSVLTNPNIINLYGKLVDKIEDFGIVSVISCYQKGIGLYINSWFMNSNMINFEMGFAVFDEIIIKAKNLNLKKIFVEYTPQENNKLCLDLLNDLGFKLLDEDENGDKYFILDISLYEYKNKFIKVEKHD